MNMSSCYSADATYSTLIFRFLNRSRVSMCLLLTELRGVVNQRFSSLVVLEDLNTCPAGLGHNKKNRTACAGKYSFTQSPAVMYSSSRGLQQYIPKLLLSRTSNAYHLPCRPTRHPRTPLALGPIPRLSSFSSHSSNSKSWTRSVVVSSSSVLQACVSRASAVSASI